MTERGLPDDGGGELGPGLTGGNVQNISTVEMKAELGEDHQGDGVAVGQIMPRCPQPEEPKTLPAVTNRRLYP